MKQLPPLVVIQAGLEGFWIHRVLTETGIESHAVDPASIAASRRWRRAKTDKLDGDTLWFVPGSPTSAVSQESAQWCERRPQKKRTGAIARGPPPATGRIANRQWAAVASPSQGSG